MTNYHNQLTTGYIKMPSYASTEESLPDYSTRPSSFDQPRVLEEGRQRTNTPTSERIALPPPVYHGRLTIREVASERSSLSHAPFYGRPGGRWALRSGRRKRMCLPVDLYVDYVMG